MAYPADPGGNFASDAHRRVMAALPNPDDDARSVEDLIENRINLDPYVLAYFEEATEVVTVLEELEAEGYAKQLKSGWKMTADGLEVLTGPPVETDAQQGPVHVGLDPGSLNGGE